MYVFAQHHPYQGCESSDLNLISDFFALHKSPFSSFQDFRFFRLFLTDALTPLHPCKANFVHILCIFTHCELVCCDTRVNIEECGRDILIKSWSRATLTKIHAYLYHSFFWKTQIFSMQLNPLVYRAPFRTFNLIDLQWNTPSPLLITLK